MIAGIQSRVPASAACMRSKCLNIHSLVESNGPSILPHLEAPSPPEGVPHDAADGTDAEDGHDDTDALRSRMEFHPPRNVWLTLSISSTLILMYKGWPIRDD